MSSPIFEGKPLRQTFRAIFAADFNGEPRRLVVGSLKPHTSDVVEGIYTEVVCTVHPSGDSRFDVVFTIIFKDRPDGLMRKRIATLSMNHDILVPDSPVQMIDLRKLKRDHPDEWRRSLMCFDVSEELFAKYQSSPIVRVEIATKPGSARCSQRLLDTFDYGTQNAVMRDLVNHFMQDDPNTINLIVHGEGWEDMADEVVAEIQRLSLIHI